MLMYKVVFPDAGRDGSQEEGGSVISACSFTGDNGEGGVERREVGVIVKRMPSSSGLDDTTVSACCSKGCEGQATLVCKR